MTWDSTDSSIHKSAALSLPGGEDATPLSLKRSREWCYRLTRRTARNFYFTFLTLPPRSRRDMCVLYAFMRVTDDLGDDPNRPVEVCRTELSQWQHQLSEVLAGGEQPHPLHPALCELIERRRIPSEYLEAVIRGVQMDLDPVRYQTFDQLANYCWHVAGAVGLCCIHIWGFRDPEALDRAADCGLALQLTNILRDLGEDAELGRVYLPGEELQQHAYTKDELFQRVRNDNFRELMQFQIERARRYYRKAERLKELLEPQGRPILSAMLRVYGGLLDEIERRDFDVFSDRIRLSRPRKLWIAADCLVRHRWWPSLTRRGS